MRIVPVTGDLPAVLSPPPPPVRQVADPAPQPLRPPVQHAAPADTGADAAADRRRSRPSQQQFFDPPLIAQRAVLGLPTGHLIAEFALAEGIAYSAASAAVDREMPRPAG